MLPVSPALSACDSLLDIEDLDAFLEGKGALSRFPTPPLRDTAYRTDASPRSVIDEGALAEQGVDYHHAAVTFAQGASVKDDLLRGETHLIYGILNRAKLPIEVLAMAYSIIAKIQTTLASSSTSILIPANLLVVSALKLATTFANDQPPKNAWWARHVCAGTWTARRIDRTALDIFECRNWTLLDCFSPEMIRPIVRQFMDGPSFAATAHEARFRSNDEKSLKVWIEGSSACWTHGQLTPDDSPECSVFEDEAEAPKH